MAGLASCTIQEEIYHSFISEHAGLFFGGFERPVVVSKLRLGAELTTDFVVAVDRRSLGIIFNLIELEVPHRKPFITPEIEAELFAYIGGILKNHESRLLDAGGTSDHVHLLISQSKNIAISALLKDVKKDSSSWI